MRTAAAVAMRRSLAALQAMRTFCAAAPDASVLSRLDALVAAGALRPAASQRTAAAALDEVIDRLAAPERSATADVASAASLPPLGAYLYGPVGSGKTALLDMAAQRASALGVAARRIHHSVLVAELHAALHAATSAAPAVQALALDGRRVHRRVGAPSDPVPLAAAALCRSQRLLLLDELAVADVADAGLLSRVLGAALRTRRLAIVATSNQAPHELFAAGGPARRYALPLIEALTQHCAPLRVSDGEDHRLSGRGEAAGAWHVTEDSDAAPSAFKAAWAMACDSEAPAMTRPAARFGRAPRVLAAGRKAARASFAQLCGGGASGDGPCGAADHLALASGFDALFLEAVPALRPSDVDAARRLVSLVDALYDNRRALYVTAAASPAQLFAPLLQAQAESRPAFSAASSLSADAAPPLSDEERLMCARCVSRLAEMCGQAA